MWPKLFFSKISQEVTSLLTVMLQVYDFSSFFRHIFLKTEIIEQFKRERFNQVGVMMLDCPYE